MNNEKTMKDVLSYGPFTDEEIEYMCEWAPEMGDDLDTLSAFAPLTVSRSGASFFLSTPVAPPSHICVVYMDCVNQAYLVRPMP